MLNTFCYIFVHTLLRNRTGYLIRYTTERLNTSLALLSPKALLSAILKCYLLVFFSTIFFFFFQNHKQSALLQPALSHFYLRVTIAGAAKGGGEAATNSNRHRHPAQPDTSGSAPPPHQPNCQQVFLFSKLPPNPHPTQQSWTAGGRSARGRLRADRSPAQHSRRSQARGGGTEFPPQAAAAAPAPRGPGPRGGSDLPPPSHNPRPPPARQGAASQPALPGARATEALGPARHRPSASPPLAAVDSRSGRRATRRARRQTPSPEGRSGPAGAILPSAPRCRLRRTNAGPLRHLRQAAGARISREASSRPISARRGARKHNHRVWRRDRVYACPCRCTPPGGGGTIETARGGGVAAP